jgi:hypothetical protein
MNECSPYAWFPLIHKVSLENATQAFRLERPISITIEKKVEFSIKSSL